MDIYTFINNVEIHMYFKNLAMFTLQEFQRMFGHFFNIMNVRVKCYRVNVLNIVLNVLKVFFVVKFEFSI